MPRGFVTLLLFVPIAVAAPVPKSLQKKLTLEGRWEAVTMHRGGVDVSQSNTTVWDIRGNSVTRYRRLEDGSLSQDTSIATLSWPDSTRRDEVDYTLDNPATGNLFRARMKLTRTELTIRFAEQGAPRPSDLSEGNDGWYYVYRRVSDD